MNQNNRIAGLSASIAKGVVGSWAVLAKTFARLALFGSRRTATSSRAPAPPTAIAGSADAGAASGQALGADLAPVLPAAVVAEAVPRRGKPAPKSPVATSRKASLAPAADPELDEVRARVASMERRIVDLETRKAEMEQLIDEFAFCQYLALGELLGEQLRLQHELLQRRAERSSNAEDRQAADAAAEEYRAYQQARNEPAAPAATLADDEREELKTLYRSAVMRCHPDRVGDADKARAHALFLRTQNAYRRRDLELMRLIIRQLAARELPVLAGDESTPRERLEVLLESLVEKGVDLLLAIESMQRQSQYRLARQRECWEAHFATARRLLEDECTLLRRQLAHC